MEMHPDTKFRLDTCQQVTEKHLSMMALSGLTVIE